MSLRTNLHGHLIVERAVPPDAQEALGKRKLSRRVPEDKSVAQVEAELDDMIAQARGPKSPIRLVIDYQGPRANADLDLMREAVTQALRGAGIRGTPKIRFEFPHKPK